MTGLNKVFLIGHLGKDPETFVFENGTKKVSFSLATNETFKNKDGEKTEKTEWHNIIMYRGLAEIAEQYLKKGSRVYLEGSLRYRNYEDKDGKKVYVSEIEADEMLMLDSKDASEHLT
jgi:single-strand DNA-binding protein